MYLFNNVCIQSLLSSVCLRRPGVATLVGTIQFFWGHLSLWGHFVFEAPDGSTSLRVRLNVFVICLIVEIR